MTVVLHGEAQTRRDRADLDLDGRRAAMANGVGHRFAADLARTGRQACILIHPGECLRGDLVVDDDDTRPDFAQLVQGVQQGDRKQPRGRDGGQDIVESAQIESIRGVICRDSQAHCRGNEHGLQLSMHGECHGAMTEPQMSSHARNEFGQFGVDRYKLHSRGLGVL